MKIAICMVSTFGEQTQFGTESPTCEKRFFADPAIVIKQLLEWKPDWIFVNKKFYMQQLQELVRKHKFKYAYYYGDYRWTVAPFVHQHLDIATLGIFTYKQPEIWALAPKKCRLTHQGARAEIHVADPTIPKKYDVIFGGNNFGGDLRMKTVKFLNDNFNFLVIGDAWPSHINSIPKKRLGHMPQYYSQGRMTVGILNFQDHIDKGVEFYTSNRLYTCSSLGIPHIAPFSPRIHELFDEGYIDWRNHDDLGNQIQHFIDNPEYARTIGSIQRQQILKYHTLEHAWARIEKILKEF